MGLYDGIKDVAKVVQQADNIELYRQLLDLEAQALEMQEEISRLKEENRELKKKQDMSLRIVRHPESYITLLDEDPTLLYCSHCWDFDGKIVQLSCNESDGKFRCPHCHTVGVYDKAKHYGSFRMF